MVRIGTLLADDARANQLVGAPRGHLIALGTTPSNVSYRARYNLRLLFSIRAKPTSWNVAMPVEITRTSRLKSRSVRRHPLLTAFGIYLPTAYVIATLHAPTRDLFDSTRRGKGILPGGPQLPVGDPLITGRQSGMLAILPVSLAVLTAPRPS